MNRRDILICTIFCLAVTGFNLLTLHHCFFWDTIQLSSAQAHWFYDQHFHNWILPNVIDSGHIPFMGVYLASVWEIFGRSLPVSHLAMLPFLIGIIYQAYILLKKFLPAELVPFSLLFILCDPTLMGQMSLVSPDIILVFAFLLSLNAILSKKDFLWATGLVLLSVISLRGMFAMAGLLLFFLATHFHELLSRTGWKKTVRHILLWLPAVLICLGYLGYHFAVTEWIGYHTGSPWEESFRFAGLTGMIRNLAVILWRLADFGRIFPGIAMIVLFLWLYRKKTLALNEINPLITLIASLAIVLLPVMIYYKGITQHRYLLPLIIMLLLLTAVLIAQTPWKVAVRKRVLILLSVALLSGNLWIYPAGLSTGWDSTLAHWPWYSLRNKMNHDISLMPISPGHIGSAFPNLRAPRYTDLTGDTTCFHQADIRQDTLIYWSNIMNDFPASYLKEMNAKWILLKEYKRRGVAIRLYQNPSYSLPLKKSKENE